MRILTTLARTAAIAGTMLLPLALWAQDAAGTHAEGTIEVAVEAAEHGDGQHVAIPFFSLFNTNFVVWIAFLVFLAILVYMKVPGRIGAMLDGRAANIRKELDEARKLREEAQAILASYERKHKDVQEQADRIVATAKAEAAAAAEKAKDDLKATIARRLAGAEDQIASAQAAAVREVRNRAAEIAIAVAGEVMSRQMTAQKGNALIDDSIETVAAKLH
jgi:F-type H+-transporting ATPase subunit b